tara:strand:+ start:2031 stop:3722 length:1692 start_codon:yes stop_codon:yes gene_type:complete
MAKLRDQSIRAHHLKVIDQVNDALKSSSLNGHSYLVRWSPDHAIKANRPQISRLLLLNINFLFHFLEDDLRRHAAQKLWQVLGPSDWGRLYSEALEPVSLLSDCSSNLPKLITLIGFLRTAGCFRESLEFAEDVATSLPFESVDEMEWVLIFQTTYAKILADTGQFDRAEGLLELVSESRRSHLGQMHNTTIDSYANLSDVKVSLGKYRDALSLRSECLNLSKKSFGESDPRTLSALNALGMLQHDLGLREESLTTYRQVIRKRSISLGDEHPSVWESKQNLAVLLTELGQFEEAASLFEDALNHSRLVRGDNDPVTIAVMNNLAVLFIETAEYSRSSPLLISVADWQKKHRSPLHLDTLLTENNLARSLEGEGKLIEAEATYRQVVRQLTSEYGLDHPKTPDVIINLAGFLEDAGQLDDSIDYYQLAVDSYAKNFGDYDHRTLNAQQMLGVCLRESGKLSMAIDVLSRAQKHCEEGSNRLAAVSNALGLTFQYANNFRSAGREFLNGLSIREELVHQGKIPVDQICQILRRIKHLLEIYPDKPLEDLLSKKLMEWSICKVAD